MGHHAQGRTILHGTGGIIAFELSQDHIRGLARQSLQAEAIRREILHARAVPWKVLGRERYLQTLDRAFNPKEVSTKPRQRLMEYGAVLGDSSLLERLASAGYLQAKDTERPAPGLRNKHLRLTTGERPSTTRCCAPTASGAAT